MSGKHYDLCVIGGGVNGAGIARDAAGRGLSVLLVEARDLASATSSSSTKLIHGGLRYLEYLEFKLVHESLKEREVLLSLAPHIIKPMEFILPHDQAQRPFMLIRAGLFLYDHLAKRKKLRGSRGIHFTGDAYSAPLREHYQKGFRYSDCWVEDSRLVVLNAMDAAEQGADIRTYTACTHLQEDENGWSLSLLDTMTGQEDHVGASMVINAAGPWVRGVLEGSGLIGSETVPDIRLVKGSHIIVKRRYEGKHAYILQQPDKRIVFAIPYEREYTLIGTTEEDFEGDPSEAQISANEIEYLCEAYNRSFKEPISKEDIVWTYSGVRPLFDEGEDSATAATRDFKLHHHREHKAPLISIFGGKLTTYRVLAERAVGMMLAIAGKPGAAWTCAHALPGGDVKDADFEAFAAAQTAKYLWLPPPLLVRYARAYGTRMDVFLSGAKEMGDLGDHYGDDVYQAEIDYLVENEWARTAEDVLWRRSKLALHVSPETIQNVEAVMAGKGQ